jgi:peptidoglycan hydrolase-like protein with peptidoglycan-binding domain
MRRKRCRGGGEVADWVREAADTTMAGLGSDGPLVSLLQVGSSGPLVRVLQSALNIVGASPPLIVDGLFGSNTQSAVLGFQQANSLATDGLVGQRRGPRSRSRLAWRPSQPARLPH